MSEETAGRQFIFTSQLHYTSKDAFPCCFYNCCYYCYIEHLLFLNLQFLHQTIPRSIISKSNTIFIQTFGTHRQGRAMSRHISQFMIICSSYREVLSCTIFQYRQKTLIHVLQYKFLIRIF